MAVLDQTGCCSHRIHRRTGVYVYSVQSLYSFMPKMEGLQPNYSGAGNNNNIERYL